MHREEVSTRRPNVPIQKFYPGTSPIEVPALFVVSLLGRGLPPLAVIAGVLGAWRFGADPGWTGRFFISKGLFSHYQSWLALAVGAHMASQSLNRWVAAQKLKSAAIVPLEV